MHTLHGNRPWVAPYCGRLSLGVACAYVSASFWGCGRPHASPSTLLCEALKAGDGLSCGISALQEAMELLVLF